MYVCIQIYTIFTSLIVRQTRDFQHDNNYIFEG